MSVQQTPDPSLPENKTYIVDVNVRFTVSAYDEDEAWMSVRTSLSTMTGREMNPQYDSKRRNSYFSNVRIGSKRVQRKYNGVGLDGGYSISFLRGCTDIADDWNRWRRDHNEWTVDENGNSRGSGDRRESFPKVTPKWVASQLTDEKRQIIEVRVVKEVYDMIQRSIEAEMEDGVEVFGVDTDGNSVGIS